MALDRVSRSVVVAVRGTWSLADFVTDIIAVPRPADWWLPPSLQQVCSYIAAGLYWLWEAGSYGVIGDGRCTATLELKIPNLPLLASVCDLDGAARAECSQVVSQGCVAGFCPVSILHQHLLA